MNAHADRTNPLRHASTPAATDRHYGRRIEADRSWTVYQVFTGIPARDGGNQMTGLSRAEATDGMQTLNRRDATAPGGRS